MSKSGLRKTLLWESLRTFASVGTYRISPVGAIPVKVKMWKAAQRLLARISAGQKVRIIHLGDHARVVKDMSLDIDERLMAFVSFHLASRNGPTPLSDRLRLERIALNMDQVRRYKSATESRQDNRFARRRVHSGARARILGTGCSR